MQQVTGHFGCTHGNEVMNTVKTCIDVYCSRVFQAGNVPLSNNINLLPRVAHVISNAEEQGRPATMDQ